MVQVQTNGWSREATDSPTKGAILQASPERSVAVLELDAWGLLAMEIGAGGR